ncbi:MAG: glycosyltransferase family 4 protein [Gaiellaceae bacterium]
MRVLLVSLYWPPAGGPGVQRPLKLAGHLAELGVEVHVLAPDDPKWLHRDESLTEPDGITVHRARNLGPRSRRPGEELHGLRGLARGRAHASLAFRRVLVPDAAVLWNTTAIPKARRIAREHGIDVVLTTSPPGSVHFVGAALGRRDGPAWVADLRDSIARHSQRRRDVRGEGRLAATVAKRAHAVICASEVIAEEMRVAGAGKRVHVVGNGADFEEFDGLEYVPSAQFRITHTGSFFGARDPRPFLEALARVEGDIVARFVGDFRGRDREHAERLELGRRLELVSYLPRHEALSLQRNSEALLLLIPHAGGRGRGVLSGKVFEYLAAERPILALVPPAGEAARLIETSGAGEVVDPEDIPGTVSALQRLIDRHGRDGSIPAALPTELRDRLARRSRAAEFLEIFEDVAR